MPSSKGRPGRLPLAACRLRDIMSKTFLQQEPTSIQVPADLLVTGDAVDGSEVAMIASGPNVDARESQYLRTRLEPTNLRSLNVAYCIRISAVLLCQFRRHVNFEAERLRVKEGEVERYASAEVRAVHGETAKVESVTGSPSRETYAAPFELLEMHLRGSFGVGWMKGFVTANAFAETMQRSSGTIPILWVQGVTDAI